MCIYQGEVTRRHATSLKTTSSSRYIPPNTPNYGNLDMVWTLCTREKPCVNMGYMSVFKSINNITII